MLSKQDISDLIRLLEEQAGSLVDNLHEPVDYSAGSSSSMLARATTRL
jgi:hypothetical protein